ncbi:MAG TPA: hypothetical protein VK177_12795 [Flavobacteriales bacterium]|nr:hypothetical protein [Flavobacteriales bacterium]
MKKNNSFQKKYREWQIDIPVKEQHAPVENNPEQPLVEEPVYLPGKNNDGSPSNRNYAPTKRLKRPTQLQPPKQHFISQLVFAINRWAKSHVLAARIIIAVITAGLSTLGLLTGKLFAGKIIISPALDYSLGVCMLVCFAVLIQSEKKKTFILPYQYKRAQAGYVLIALLFVINSFSSGTRLGTQQEQITPYGYVAQKVENNLKTPVAESQQSEDPDPVSKEDITGLVVLYVILILILMFALFCLCCMAFCAGGAAGGIPATIAAVFIIWLVMNAMVKHVDRKKLGLKKKEKDNPDTLD